MRRQDIQGAGLRPQFRPIRFGGCLSMRIRGWEKSEGRLAVSSSRWVHRLNPVYAGVLGLMLESTAFSSNPARHITPYLRFVDDQQMPTSVVADSEPGSTAARDGSTVFEPIYNRRGCSSDFNLGYNSCALRSVKVLQPAEDDRGQWLLSNHNVSLRLRPACHVFGDASVGATVTLTDLVGGRKSLGPICRKCKVYISAVLP